MNQIPNQREAEILQVLLNGERYGREIRNEYEQRTGIKFPLGALYVTLDRMILKGYLKSREGETTEERGSHRRKYFELTAAGTHCASAIAAFTANGPKVVN